VSANPTTAMVLAAGLGTRMRPITERIPKPLVEVSGRTLLDRGLDSLAEAGVERAVVNVHHHTGQMIAHVAGRTRPKVAISDESDGLLDSAGGVIKALPQLGPRPFFLINADTFWIDRDEPNLTRLALAWDGARMDILLMLAELSSTTGHAGMGDFSRDAEGRLTRARNSPDGLVYAGAGIFDPKLFAGAPVAKRSLNEYFDRAAEAGRLHGVVMQGHWITVGTPDAIALAEAAVARALAERR
jgi:MurNAc alpha-1-phosphate uridylyltransferase